MFAGLFGPMATRFVASRFEQRATQEIGKRVARGVTDIAENIVTDTISGGLADFTEGATGHRPKIFTGGPSLGAAGSMGYTMLWGQYNKKVADDMTSSAIPQRSTLFQMGASARDVSGFDRVRAMSDNSTKS